MIILDEDDLPNSKDPPVPTPSIRYPPSAAGRRPFSPLPDYETSQALAFSGFNDSLITFHKPPPKRRILDSKFWKASILSLAVYIFLTIVVGIPIIVEKTREAAGQSYPYYTSNYVVPWPKKSPSRYLMDLDNISDFNGGICNNWTYAAQLEDGQGSVVGTIQSVLSSNGQFSITSNTTYSSGMNIVQGDLFVGINPDSSETNTTISITMQASSMDLFEQTPVCLASATNLTNLSIYTPANFSLFDQLLFNITLLYPQSPIPADIHTFATFLPLFTQTLGNFGGYVNFQKVSIEGPVSKIFVDLLQADHVLVDTALEPIVGQFSATDSLTISTVQAPLNANISLYNDPGSDFPTYLEVDTGNSDLTVNVTLNSPNQTPPLRPNFIANLRTFNGSATANFAHDPSSPPTSIKLRVENDLGPSNVMLDQKYQGNFQVSTKLASAGVTVGTSYSPSPWAQGSPRNLILEYDSPVRSYGWIGWGLNPGYSAGEQQGEVVVETSLANCSLAFAG